jgi:hypothetical protein
VRKEGVRRLLYWVGVAIGGLRHETVEVAERKFLDLADGVISAAQAKKTMDLCWKIRNARQSGRSAAQRGDLRPDRIIEQKEETHAPNADRCGMPDGRHAPRLDRR